MRKVLLVGVLLVATGAAAAIPVSKPDIIAKGTGPLGVDFLVSVLGYVPEAAELSYLGPEGRVTRMVAWQELSAALEGTVFGGRRAPADGPINSGTVCGLDGVAGLYCGPDAGSGDGIPAVFCDDSSGWVIHGAGPGAAFTEMIPGTGPLPTICGGFFGPTVFWDSIELSSTKNPDVLLSQQYDGCYADVWLVHSNGYCPNSFPASGGGMEFDTFLLGWRADGPGVAASFDFGGTVLDYLIGLGTKDCFDMMSQFTGPNAVCARD